MLPTGRPVRDTLFLLTGQAGMAGPLPNLTKKEYAAVLLADDSLPDRVIAARVGVTRQTLHNWKQKPEFAAMVTANAEELTAGVLPLAIANKRIRVEVLDDLHNRAIQVIEDRAARYADELAEADSAIHATRRFFGDSTPTEAATGLLVKKETVNNSGMRTVDWAVDVSLIREIRAIHEQAAKELGQWDATVNVRHTGRIDHVHRIPQSLQNLSDAELEALEAIAIKAQEAEYEVSA